MTSLEEVYYLEFEKPSPGPGSLSVSYMWIKYKFSAPAPCFLHAPCHDDHKQTPN